MNIGMHNVKRGGIMERDGKIARKLSKHFHGFKKYFSVGAPCQLIDENINPHEGIANGSFGTVCLFLF